jgi:hypothetical protein
MLWCRRGAVVRNTDLLCLLFYFAPLLLAVCCLLVCLNFPPDRSPFRYSYLFRRSVPRRYFLHLRPIDKKCENGRLKRQEMKDIERPKTRMRARMHAGISRYIQHTVSTRAQNNHKAIIFSEARRVKNVKIILSKYPGCIIRTRTWSETSNYSFIIHHTVFKPPRRKE